MSCLYQRLSGHARFQPHKTAIEFKGRQLSYQQLDVLVQKCTRYFQLIGLQAGDRVAVLALNHPDWFVALFAAARTGVLLVPLNWRLSTEELQFVLEDCQPKLLLYDDEFADTAEELAGAFANVQLQMLGSPEFPPLTNQAQLLPTNADASIVQEAGELLIVYTSGTTGRPKGAVLNQAALICSAGMSQHMLDLNPSDRVLNVLPLFHVGGLNIQPLPALLYGATLILHSRFDAGAALTAIDVDKVTLMNSVPTLLQAILDTKGWLASSLATLRAISIGSTDVPVSLIRKLRERGIPLIQAYGATETSPMAIYQRVEQAEVEGSIGCAGLLCDVRLVGQNGEPVAVGESGEIQVRGENVLSRYWNNPEATVESLKDGWFSTGDIAHQDDSGFFWFDDRVKYVVISGGENIYPAELERVIREVSGVEAVAVVGKSDERWGEVPVAAVVASGSVDAQTILNACSKIARFKQPREVIFLNELPRNALGKIQIPQLKQILGQTTAAH